MSCRPPISSSLRTVGVWSVALLAVAVPTVGYACNMCAVAEVRVVMPGVLDAARCLLVFFGASLLLTVLGRVTGSEWRLGSKIYWLVVPAVLVGAVVALSAGMLIVAGPVVLIASVLRIQRARKLSRPSLRERGATWLAGIFVVATPIVLWVGNQRAGDVEYLFDCLGSWHHVTSSSAFEVLGDMPDAPAVACARLEALEASPSELPGTAWFGLMRLAEQGGGCPERVASVRTTCRFPDDASMDRRLVCGEAPDE